MTPDNGNTAIEVRGLAKRFGEVQAVAGIDFDVRERAAPTSLRGLSRSAWVFCWPGASRRSSPRFRWPSSGR